MDNHGISLGFLALFIASIWVIALLWAIYKVLSAILDELRRISGSDNDLDR
jgi:hypothetical protein